MQKKHPISIPARLEIKSYFAGGEEQIFQQRRLVSATHQKKLEVVLEIHRGLPLHAQTDHEPTGHHRKECEMMEVEECCLKKLHRLP
jgi:hypothetical protein